MPLMMENITAVDSVRPGEQWFCYWKTSAALWESRILEVSPQEIIFIPLFWGFHQEQDGWDFGKVLPERDLLRLSQLLEQHNRKFCWLLPLSPSPFLPNGGVPAQAARTLSVSGEGVHLAVLDQEDKLHKMYSYFEPKVFQGFVDFLGALGKFLGTGRVKAPLWGATFHYLEGKKCLSYLADSSVAFEQGFSRYLRQNFKEGVDLTDPLEEGNLKGRFTEEVQALFRSTAETALGPFWMGTREICVLGGGPSETIERSLADGKSQLHFVEDLFEHYSNDRWISSVLLKKDEKGEVFPHILREHFGSREIERRYHYHLQGHNLTEEWSSFGLIDIFDPGVGGHFRKSGLIPYLEGNFRWMYSIRKELNFTTESIEENQDKIKFFHGRGLDRTRFGQMLKLFMMGERVVLDTAGLPSELQKRLDIFLLENSIKQQSINFVTAITMGELGEGRFITYEGQRLNQENSVKFWSHLFKYFNLGHVDIRLDENVFGLWRIRASGPNELNFLDVRRVNLYNPTSYKKQVTISTKGAFAFMKMIDPSKASAKSIGHGVEVEILPHGRIALDFGHYEDRRGP